MKRTRASAKRQAFKAQASKAQPSKTQASKTHASSRSAPRPQGSTRTKPGARKRKRTSYALIEKSYPEGRRVEFPDMQGRKLEKIVITTSSDYHAISIRFQDKKSLHLVINPGFKIKAAFRDWTDGNGRDIKLWPPIESARG